MKTTKYNHDDSMLEFLEDGLIVNEFETTELELPSWKTLRHEWIQGDLTDEQLEARIARGKN